MPTLVVDYVVPDRLREVPRDERRRPPMPPMSIGLLKAMTPATLDGTEIRARCWDEQAMGRYAVDRQRPDILCLSALTTSAARGYQLAEEARDCAGQGGAPIKVALGGIHATALPREALHYADAVALGETAPSTLRAMLSWLIAQRNAGRSEKCAFESRLKPGAREIEERPVPDWSWVPPKGYIAPWSMQTSSGCPFGCPFCSVTFVYGAATRHVSYGVIEEDARRVGRSGRGGIGTIIDDNFLPNKAGEHAKRVCEIFRRNGVQWVSEMTARTLYGNWREMVPLFARSGCRGLYLGIENLAAKMTKSITLEQTAELIRRLHDHGIAVLGAFVFGVTDEDGPEVFERTVDWAVRAKLDLAQFSINTPEPGARDFEACVRGDLITDWNWEHYDAEHPVRRFPRLSQEAMYDGLRNAYRWFYSASGTWKRLAPSLMDLCRGGNLRRTVFMAAVNAYLHGTQRGWNNRSSFARFEGEQQAEPNALVLEQFAEGMPEGQYDVRERNRALLDLAPNPLHRVIPGVPVRG